MALAVECIASDKELRLIVMIARGYTTDTAARELNLSRHTIGERISQLLGRFDCKNRAELIAYCYVHGLLVPKRWPPQASTIEVLSRSD